MDSKSTLSGACFVLSISGGAGFRASAGGGCGEGTLNRAPSQCSFFELFGRHAVGTDGCRSVLVGREKKLKNCIVGTLACGCCTADSFQATWLARRFRRNLFVALVEGVFRWLSRERPDGPWRLIEPSKRLSSPPPQTRLLARYTLCCPRGLMRKEGGRDGVLILCIQRLFRWWSFSASRRRPSCPIF